MSDNAFVMESLSELIELSQTAEPHTHAREPPPTRRYETRPTRFYGMRVLGHSGGEYD
jgi:hypothetical protein